MPDKKVNGEFLPEGIYMEAVRLGGNVNALGGVVNINVDGNVYHSYLVYRDGEGNAEVIRGGFDPADLNFFDLVIYAGVDISTTRDAYDDKTNFDQKDHVYAKLDIGDRNPKEFWDKVMVPNAQKIDTTINYTIKPRDMKIENGQILLHANSVVCHSVVGTTLRESGLSIDDAIKSMNESSSMISEDSLRGIRTDLFRDDLDRGIYDETVRAINNTVDSAKEKINNGVENVKDGINTIKNTINFIDGAVDKAREVKEAIDRIKDILDGNLRIFSELNQDMNNIEELMKIQSVMYAQNDERVEENLSSIIASSLSISENNLEKFASSKDLENDIKKINDTFSSNSKDEDKNTNNNLNTHMA